METTKPFSFTTERDQGYILEILKQAIPMDRKVRLLEIGSGTGQHAVFFAPHFPKLEWWTSDLPALHEGILAWTDEAALPNVFGPLEFDLSKDKIGPHEYDFIFISNVLHVVSWEAAKKFLSSLKETFKEGGDLLIFGPFNWGGQPTSEANAELDQWLKNQDPNQGLRNFEDVRDFMQSLGFNHHNNLPLPSDNHFLHFRLDAP